MAHGDRRRHTAASLAPDLLDSHEVAAILGLGSHRSVSTYRARHDDFPEPVIVKGHGRCVLWWRADVEAWAAERRR